MQRLAQEWTQSVRAWLGQRLGVERTESPRARQFIAQAQTQQNTQRQSRGIHM